MLYETENEGVSELDQCPICSLQDLCSILHENILSLCKALSSSSHREYLRGKPIGTLSLLSVASFPSPTSLVPGPAEDHGLQPAGGHPRCGPGRAGGDGGGGAGRGRGV